MGNFNHSKTKYVLLYGLPGAGKTLFQYQLQSGLPLEKEKLKQTYGVSFEVVSMSDIELGIFDVSGSLKQYGIVDIIMKSVDIEGIIFIVNLEQLEKIDEASDALEMIIGNNFIKSSKCCLLVLYNKKDLGDKIDWMEPDLLDNRLGIWKLKKKYELKSVHSEIIDISTIRIDGIEELEKFAEKIK